MKNLLDISNDTVRRERKRSWQRLAGVSVLVLVTAAAIAYSLLTVTEQRQSPVFLKESENGADYIYLVENGHLLKLKCGADVAFDTVTVDDRAYQMDCRWNKLTYEGTVTACEATDTIWLGGLMDVTYEAEQAPMLGESEVYFTSENYYPDPYAEDRGREFLCDFRFWLWRAEDDTTQTILTVKDCKNAVPADYDGDGLNEVVVRTRWPEKPYTVYDMVDGEITEVWPDTIPDEIKEQLVCIWEQ